MQGLIAMHAEDLRLFLRNNKMCLSLSAVVSTLSYGFENTVAICLNDITQLFLRCPLGCKEGNL